MKRLSHKLSQSLCLLWVCVLSFDFDQWRGEEVIVDSEDGLDATLKECTATTTRTEDTYTFENQEALIEHEKTSK